MPYCPNCKTEFRKGFTNCSDCNAQLVNKLIEENKNKDDIEELPLDVPIDTCLLITINEGYQVQIIRDLLMQENIPSYTKESYAGTKMKLSMGYSVYGTDIYVSTLDYEKAKEVLEYFYSKPEIDENEQTEEYYDDRPLYEQRISKAINYLPIVLALIAGVVYGGIQLYKFLFK